MSTSPTLSISEPGDVFERLAACQGFLTARDVAKMLSISKKTVYSYVSRNMIPHYKIEANVRFRPLELAEWLRKRAFSCRREDPPCIDASESKTKKQTRQEENWPRLFLRLRFRGINA